MQVILSVLPWFVRSCADSCELCQLLMRIVRCVMLSSGLKMQRCGFGVVAYENRALRDARCRVGGTMVSTLGVVIEIVELAVLYFMRCCTVM